MSAPASWLPAPDEEGPEPLLDETYERAAATPDAPPPWFSHEADIERDPSPSSNLDRADTMER